MITSAHHLLPNGQRRPYNCGPTCLANALGILGLPISQLEAQGACGTGVDGTNDADLCKGIRALGFRPRIMRASSQADNQVILARVKTETDAGRLVIASINGYDDEGHWILILRIIDRFAHVWDPNNPASKRITVRNLLRAWWNIYPRSEKNAPIEGEIWAVSLCAGNKAAVRAIHIRRNLLHPRTGYLPTKK